MKNEIKIKENIKDTEKVSVIIPVYKVEKYLDKCVESVVNQTYKNLEIILVDDGSPDNCPKLCDEWAKKDERIIVIHKENGGLSSARNVGIDNATGDYLCFVDSDDSVCPQMVEILWKNLKNNLADISMCNWQKVSDINNPHNKTYDADNVKLKVFEGDDVFGLLFDKKVPLIMVAWAKLYKKGLFENIRYPLGKIHEDEAVIHKILNRCKKLCYTDYKMYNYTQRDDSITATSFSKKRLQVLSIMKDRVEFVEKNRPQFLDKEIHHYIKILILYYHYVKWAKLEKEILNQIEQEIDLYISKGYTSKLIKLFKKYPKILNVVLKLRNKIV